MAAGIRNEMISAHVSKTAVSDKNHVVCDCCGKITAELNEVKLELSSFREILRVLQEEICEISPLRTKEMKVTKTKYCILYQ